ncbi:MAG: hypothetical protein AAGF97_11710, partial [Planctomycetota bacterium]
NDVYNGGAPFEGQDFTFTSVIESNTNGAGASVVNYFQDPQVSGDMFILDPHDLRVDVTPGPGTSTLTDQLEMIIQGKSGQSVSQILLSNIGDYRAIGTGSSVEAEINYFWEVMAGSSAGANGSGSVMFNKVGDPSSADPWLLMFAVDLPADSTEVLFRLDHTQTASASSVSAAAYTGSLVPNGLTVTVVVPEPTAYGLATVMLLSVCVWRRR